MASLRPDPFETALALVSTRLNRGVAPGEVFVAADLARELGCSTTPVREALAWLAGAGRLSRRMRRGYEAPRLSVGAILDLYALRQGLFSLAGLSEHQPGEAGASRQSEGWISDLHALGRRADNLAVRQAIEQVMAALAAADRSAGLTDHPPLPLQPSQWQAWIEALHESLKARVVDTSRMLDRQSDEDARVS